MVNGCFSTNFQPTWIRKCCISFTFSVDKKGKRAVKTKEVFKIHFFIGTKWKMVSWWRKTFFVSFFWKIKKMSNTSGDITTGTPPCRIFFQKQGAGTFRAWFSQNSFYSAKKQISKNKWGNVFNFKFSATYYCMKKCSKIQSISKFQKKNGWYL